MFTKLELQSPHKEPPETLSIPFKKNALYAEYMWDLCGIDAEILLITLLARGLQQIQ